MPVDYSTDVGKVRALIPDVEEVDFRKDGDPSYLFDDDQLEALLAVSDDNVRRAAADAVEALATSEAYISKVVRTEDLQTDGAKVANAMLVRAAQLRREADAEDERAAGDSFDVIPYFPRPAEPYRWPR